MTNVTVVKQTVDGWKDAVLAHDTDTDSYFVVSTAAPAWAPDKIETLAYRTDSEGSVESAMRMGSVEEFGGAPVWVAGGRGMDRDEALADLSARLQDDVLLTVEQVTAANEARIDEDQEAFHEWLQQDPLNALMSVLG